MIQTRQMCESVGKRSYQGTDKQKKPQLLNSLLIGTLIFTEHALLVSNVIKQSQVRLHSTEIFSHQRSRVLECPGFQCKTDWSEGAVAVEAAVGCGLGLPGSSHVYRTQQAVYSWRRGGGGSGRARCHARGQV